jgi:S-adenosylmethionine hydrolase
VGPDNGLLSVLAARAASCRVFRVSWQPNAASATFAGRDLFAPVCAWLATGRATEDFLAPIDALEIQFDAAELPRVIYIDHFGNAWTGIRAGLLNSADGVKIGALRLPHARTFADAEKGTAFWYANSVGLVEIAANRANAASLLGLAVGDRITLDAEQNPSTRPLH